MSRKALKMGYRSADIMYMSRTKIKVGHKRRNIVYMSQTKTKPGHKRRNIVYMSQTKTKLDSEKKILCICPQMFDIAHGISMKKIFTGRKRRWRIIQLLL